MSVICLVPSSFGWKGGFPVRRTSKGIIFIRVNKRFNRRDLRDIRASRLQSGANTMTPAIDNLHHWQVPV